MARLDANEEVMVVGDAQQTATRPKANTAYREGAFNWHLRGAAMWIVSMSTASYFDVGAHLHRRQTLLHQTRGGHGGGGTKLGIDAGKFGACLAVGIEFGGFERRRSCARPHHM